MLVISSPMVPPPTAGGLDEPEVMAGVGEVSDLDLNLESGTVYCFNIRMCVCVCVCVCVRVCVCVGGWVGGWVGSLVAEWYSL